MQHSRPQSDFSEELQAHLAIEIDRLRAEGLGEEEADRQARRNLGNLAIAGERFYESRRWLWLDHFLQDTRQTFRRMRKAPAFTITVILTLALGIGATTSIFTLVHAVLLRSLPVAKPDQLYRLGKQTRCCLHGGYSQPKGEFSLVSYELYKHFRDHTNGFAELAAFGAGEEQLGARRAQTAEVAQSFPDEFVSGNYFRTFGVSAYAGRAFTDNDDRANALPVAMMSYRLWQQKYALSPSVVGGVFNLDDKPFTIVGITPPGFYGDTLRNAPPDFYLPLSTEPLLRGETSMLRTPRDAWLDLIGRIQPGANPKAIEAQMRVQLQQWLRSHLSEMSADNRALLPQQTLYLSPGGAGITSMREQYEHWLFLLTAISGMVLLIVCANVANLMLVRGMERRQQTSLSMALGAPSRRLVQQTLTESISLSVLGGLAGLGIAYGGTRLILHFAFSTQPGLAGIPISAAPSLPILFFAFSISLLTGVAFAVAPAWMATRVDPIEALRGANRSTVHAASVPRKMLVVVQAALSLVLLSASGLLTAALLHLENQNFGFQQDRRTIVNFDPLLAGYRADQLGALNRRIQGSLAGLPGVESVALCWYSPQSGRSPNTDVFLEGHPAPGPHDDVGSLFDRVTSGYFDAIGTRIEAGRALTGQDTATSRHVAVVNQAFARRFFPRQNPIGQHFGTNHLANAGDYEIVGVAADARYNDFDLDKPVGPAFFLPEAQTTAFASAADKVFETDSHFLRSAVIVNRPGAAVTEAAIRRAIAAADPKLPVIDVQSLKQQVSATFSQQQLIARLTSLFGILSLVLASVGLYGITAYNVGRRTNEIGVRMALGANQGQVIGLILRGAFVLIAFGLVLGVPLSLGAGGLMSSALYGVSPYNVTVIGAAILALGVSAFIAAIVPAIRASSISPMRALRLE